jgi:dihydroflavonol-4-reductase
MRVFVTGGNGFIGSRVVRKLRQGGHEVRCLVREKSDTRRIDDLVFERHTGDVRDPSSLAQGAQGCDAIVHLASVSSWDQIRSPALEATIVEGTRNVLDAAVAAGNVRVSYVSSATAINGSVEPRVFDESARFELEGTPLRYAICKHRAEQLVAEYVGRGLPVVITNPGETYGADDTGFVTAGNVRDAIRDWPGLACTGGFSMCHVDDVAEGIVVATEKGRTGERYILAGDNLHVLDFVRLVHEVAALKKPIVKVPNALMKGAIGAMARLGLPTPVIPEVLDYATMYWFFDSTKAKTELGYAPRPARQVLEPVVRWLRDAGHVPSA